ncbi:MAG: lysophospholipid acyltransferase family protein [Chitinispirillaceae bacterium]
MPDYFYTEQNHTDSDGRFIIKQACISHYFEYAALRLLEIAVNLLPRRIALSLGAAGGNILYFSGIYKKIVWKNLNHVGFWDEQQSRIIVKKLYRNMGRYAVDFLRSSLPPHKIHNFNTIPELLERGKGIIIVLAHFGNWELLAAVFGSKLDNLNVIAKPMHNPLVEKWLYRKRTASSVTTIHTSKALRKMYKVLKENGLTAILIDQHLQKMGTPAPFLGKTADTVRTVAGLVRKTDAGVLPVYALLREDSSYEIQISHAPLPEHNGTDEEETVKRIQIQHNNIISQWIREHPEHWFGWFHRRFRGYIRYKD